MESWGYFKEGLVVVEEGKGDDENIDGCYVNSGEVSVGIEALGGGGGEKLGMKWMGHE